MSGGHSRIAPSASGEWVNCTGSVLMQERFPETEESEQSKEGTASHWTGFMVLDRFQAGIKRQCSDFINKTAPNGVVVTDEMAEGADCYVQDVLSTVNFWPDFYAERRVDMKRIHADAWGTPDSWFFNKKTGRLIIWDYKYGHRVVDPYENWQMICYIVGIIAFLFPNKHEPDITIEVRIVQPRAYHHEGPIRTWTTRPEMLRAHINRLSMAAVEALSENPVTRSGEWCRDCSAKLACRTYHRTVMSEVQMVGDMSTDIMDPEQLGIVLHILRRAEKLIGYQVEALEAQAIAMYRSGTPVPGWMIEQGKGREKWSRPIAEVIALGDLMGVDLRKPPEAITPKQAIKAGIDAAVIKSYSEIPNTGIKLLPDDGSKAKRVFSKP